MGQMTLLCPSELNCSFHSYRFCQRLFCMQLAAVFNKKSSDTMYATIPAQNTRQTVW